MEEHHAEDRLSKQRTVEDEFVVDECWVKILWKRIVTNVEQEYQSSKLRQSMNVRVGDLDRARISELDSIGQVCQSSKPGQRKNIRVGHLGKSAISELGPGYQTWILGQGKNIRVGYQGKARISKLDARVE